VSKVPSLSYDRIVRALQTGAAKGKPPAAAEEVAGGDPESDGYRPVKRSTLAHILKEARLDLDTFLALL